MMSLQVQPTTTNRPRRIHSGDAYARRKSTVENEAHSYHPSLVNRIVAISSIDGTVNYTYGIGGNSAPELLRTADYSNAAIPDEVYNHDQNYNRILDSEHGAGFVYGPGNRLVSDGIYNYQYDHEGNMTRRTEIATGDYRVFDYDERNRLVALADYDFAGATLMTEQMSYDAFDRRITLQVDTAPGDGVEAAVTHFGYDGEDVIVDAVDPDGASGPAAAAVETTYLHGAGIDEVLAQEKAGMGTQWLLTDHLGSTRDIVDNSGNVLNHIVFASFGGIVSQSNAAFSSRYLYTQREFDAASGLNYYRARYYDASVGRFLSEDPVRFSNLYAYTESNPIYFRDPFGLQPTLGDTTNRFTGEVFHLLAGDDRWGRNHIIHRHRPGTSPLQNAQPRGVFTTEAFQPRFQDNALQLILGACPGDARVTRTRETNLLTGAPRDVYRTNLRIVDRDPSTGEVTAVRPVGFVFGPLGSAVEPTFSVRLVVDPITNNILSFYPETNAPGLAQEIP